MKLNLFSLVAVLSLGTEAWAWTCSGTSKASRATRQSSRLFGVGPENNDHDNNQQLSHGASSRRQWLAGVAASTTGALTLGLNNRPGWAVELPSSTALCDPTVSVWERNGRIVYLLGTAHISEVSAELAGQLVRDTHPDAVFVELDLKRLGGTSTMAKQMQENGQQLALSASGEDMEDAKPSRVMMSPVGRTPSAALESSSTSTAVATTAAPVEEEPKQSKGAGGSSFLNNLGAAAVGKGIRSMYGKLGNEGFKPGDEFIVAIKEGQKQGAAIVLGDQDVDVTLRRMAQALQKTDLNRLLNPDSELEQSMREMLPTSSTSGMSEKDAFKTEMSAFVETMKTKDNVKRIMGLMQKEAPALYQVMVSERDAYMAAGLNTLNEFTIITAVMGLAHLDGIERNLEKEGWRPVRVPCPRA